MKRLFALACVGLLWGFVSIQRPAAQNLMITNARIIDGNGAVIPRGSVVIRNGRIASVSAGSASEPGARQIDAHGMTVLPGFIDDHRHVIGGSFPPAIRTSACVFASSIRGRAPRRPRSPDR